MRSVGQTFKTSNECLALGTHRLILNVHCFCGLCSHLFILFPPKPSPLLSPKLQFCFFSLHETYPGEVPQSALFSPVYSSLSWQWRIQNTAPYFSVLWFSPSSAMSLSQSRCIAFSSSVVFLDIEIRFLAVLKFPSIFALLSFCKCYCQEQNTDPVPLWSILFLFLFVPSSHTLSLAVHF